ncbi:MAG: DUF1934 domain-containing protein [Tissierellia bacterium]|nr:DUF1934 domain-containing protein [Tissierellia bacterium]
MKSKVLIHMETVFDKNGEFEDRMVFFTEGEMEKCAGAYCYHYDESALYPSSEELVGMLEIGDGYVTRSVSGMESYVMHFREHHRDRVVLDSDYGPLKLTLLTEKIDSNLVEGLGKVKLTYQVIFAQTNKMMNEITITIEGQKQ